VDKTPLYIQIADTIRQQVLDGKLRPGDALAPVREMAERWGCTPGTVQQAYKELARQGLAVSRSGQGTRVGTALPAQPPDRTPLRRASLVHQAEAFLLEVLAAGHTPAEAESAFRAALDRWRALSAETAGAPTQTLRFVGSNDPALSLVASRFAEICPGCTLDVAFTGSLGGLIALAEGKAYLAGSHLWDAESDMYNAPFVRRLLPGRRIALLTLAHRRLGLIVPPGNPPGLTGLADLARPELRFINRQRGAGTRVWLDAQLRRLGIAAESIAGYDREAATHAEIARAVAEGNADVGLGIEAAALEYGLGFVLLATEPYDLVIPVEAWESAPVQALAAWLRTEDGRMAIAELGGYETEESGRVSWVGDREQGSAARGSLQLGRV
jgi:molybdate-binding protein/DNA-binding transcriptional regulator YhcF (GntR family)